MKALGQHFLGLDYLMKNQIRLDLVDYEIHEDIFYHDTANPTWISRFHKVGDVIQKPGPKSSNPDILMETSLYISSQETKYYRISYTYIDLMSEVGGFAKSLMAGFGALLMPFSTFFFYIHSIQKIFLKGEALSDDVKGGSIKRNGNEYFQDSNNIPPSLQQDSEFMDMVNINNPIQLSLK